MSSKTHSFNAEIKQLLDIVVHSLYSQKEIFLRELISNASDALDKLRFASITDPSLVTKQHDYYIRLEPLKDKSCLKISDSGIGMSPDEVVNFIGTIAKSGTKAFSQVSSEELKNRPELIGQFGVGFYSAFMVADKVTLHTQKAGSNVGTLWESKGDGTFTTNEVPRAEGTGTTITLHLKKFEDEDAQDFTDSWTLKSLVKKYSDFIAWPIKMKTKVDEKSEEKDEVLNSQKALWLRPASEISKEEHKEFYQHLSHDWNEPLKTIHYKAEGTMEFASLMYIPSQRPWNYQMKEYEYGLNLYIKRVFIMDHCKDLLPPWLRFIKGLVDSSDLSLNVSRELLQQDRQVTQIKKNVVHKVLTIFKEMLGKERSDYEKMWQEFGPTLKEGMALEPLQKDKLSEILLFKSTTSDAWTSLDEYVGRMKPEQKDIYFLSGERLETLKNSPYLEKIQDKGYEVLLLTDAVDEWVTQELKEYKSKKVVSIANEKLDLDSEEEKKQKAEEKKALEERFKPLVENMKLWLSTQVKDVVFSDRLVKTPVCLVNEDNAMSARMEKILSQMGQAGGMGSKRILEVNPKHKVFDTMMSLPEEKQKIWSEILYNQALLTEGTPLPDPVRFSNMIADLMS